MGGVVRGSEVRDYTGPVLAEYRKARINRVADAFAVVLLLPAAGAFAFNAVDGHSLYRWILALAVAPTAIMRTYDLVRSSVWHLEVTSRALRWRTLTRSGEVPLHRIRRVRPRARGLGEQVLIEIEGDSSLLIREARPERLSDVTARLREVAACRSDEFRTLDPFQ